MFEHSAFGFVFKQLPRDPANVNTLKTIVDPYNNLLKIAINFLSVSLNMCFGCSKELSHRDGSFEYPQHMFWLRNKKNNVQLGTLILGPENLND